MNFHETPVGRKFFNQDVPKLVKHLESIADEIRQLRLALTPVDIPVTEIPPERKWFRNYYNCPTHGLWDSEWYHTCDDRCPSCGDAYSPYKSEDLRK